MLCEMCNKKNAKRRDDNIYVCNSCDIFYPIPKKKERNKR